MEAEVKDGTTYVSKCSDDCGSGLYYFFIVTRPHLKSS